MNMHVGVPILFITLNLSLSLIRFNFIACLGAVSRTNIIGPILTLNIKGLSLSQLLHCKQKRDFCNDDTTTQYIFL